MTAPLLQNLDQLPEALSRRGLDPRGHEELLARMHDYFDRYADLERRLLGEVWVSYPAHLFAEPIPEDPMEAGEVLARRERARLRLGDGESGDLMALLDREGLKVYRPQFPEGTPLEGIFLFDAEAGPILVVDGRLTPLEADFVFARLYAHYLVDNDPYVIHLLVRGAEASAQDLRAQSFAAAFLVPAEGLAAYFEALKWVPGTALDAPTALQLAAYFEVGYRTLLARLLTLNLVQPDEIPPLLIVLEAGGEPDAGGRERNAISERFLRLALEAHARKFLDDRALAETLETDRPTARRLAGRFRVSEEAEAGAPEARPGGASRPRAHTARKGRPKP